MSQAEVTGESDSTWRRSRALIERATGLERIIYTSIGRALVHRPAVAPGAKGFSFHRGATAVFVIFIALSALELVIIDLIIQGWLLIRIVFDVLDAWGLVWMIGLLCAHIMRPHTVGPDGIRMRDGFDLNIHAVWEDVYSVAVAKHKYEPKTPRVVTSDDAVTLAVSRGSETNVEIVLERPTAVKLPGLSSKGGQHTVTRLRLWADDPRAFLTESGNYLRG
ncbi:MAG: hypothetical protein EPN48_02980 [Microbacteriaceae bacterium]|nr:MAG: hypothetical protein EPN48_02980 [Microbacteriaceae bacterium]